jgi:hypothetical protein
MLLDANSSLPYTQAGAFPVPLYKQETMTTCLDSLYCSIKFSGNACKQVNTMLLVPYIIGNEKLFGHNTLLIKVLNFKQTP